MKFKKSWLLTSFALATSQNLT